MKRKALFLAALLILTVAGCKGSSSISVPVYYVLNNSDSGLFATREVLVNEQAAAWRQALDAVLIEPKDENLKSVFPSGARIEKAEIHDRIADITLSPEAGSLEGITLSMARACLVLTLTAFEEIEGVRILSDTDPSMIFRADHFILDSLVRPGTEHDFIWYYTDSTERYMIPEARSLVVRDNDKDVEEYIFRELAASPVTPGLTPVIPEGTTLLSIQVEDNICKLNLSEEFVNRAPDSTAAARMTLCCIAGSLTALSHIDAVQLLVNGQPLKTYGRWDTSEPITADPYALRRISEGFGRDITLWIPVADGLLPFHLYTAQYDEKALLDEIVENPPVGAKRIFPPNVRIIDLVQNGLQYTVTLSDEFLRTPPEADPWLALQSIAHLLDGILPGASIQLEVQGKPVTEYFDVRLPGPITADPNVVLQD